MALKSDQTSTFPADTLPSELIHLVFAYLEPKEAATFRWAGRVVAKIGLHYLTPKVCLRLSEESYDRLLAIAEHPVASKCVVELEYENEGLRFLDREAFDRTFRTPASIARTHAWRTYEEECRRNMPPLETAQLLDRAWSVYDVFQADHKKVEQANFFPEKTVEAFKRLPKLRSISTPTIGVYERCVAEIKGELPTYLFEEKDPSCVRLHIGATLSILLAVESAALQIESFCCNKFSWQTLMQDMSNLPALRRSILHLQLIDISFTKPFMRDDDRSGEVDVSIKGYLKKRRIRSFLTSAPSLQYLGLSFRTWPHDSLAPRLRQVIGNFHWPSLKTISLDTVAVSEHSLVGFCKIHAHTLRDLSLRNIQMGQGLWNATFHSMRRVFRLGQQLDTCTLEGEFGQDESGLDLYLGMPGFENKETLGAVISEYIRATHIGDIKLVDYYRMMGLL